MRAASLARIIGATALVVASWLAAGCQFVFGEVEIEKASAVAECNSGDFRCNGEYLLACSASSGWVLEDTCATAARCDPGVERCTVCKDGDFRCNGAAREACEADGSGWREVETCSSADMCSPTGCGPCTPGEHQCSGPEQRELRECGPDQAWVTLDICATTSLCEASLDMALANPSWGKTCEQPGCNQPGTYSCDGPRLLRCPQDRTGWVEVDACATAALCEVGAQAANASVDPNAPATVDMCPEGCPAAGTFVCEGMTLRRCSDDMTRWQDVKTCGADTECNPAQGDCTARCSPGEMQCNGADLRRCNDSREWVVTATCASAALCTASGTAGSCRDPVCPRAGDYRCDGADLSECSLDLTAWEPRATCGSASLCNALSKRCDPAACDPPDGLRCFDNVLRRCRAELTGWDTRDTCTEGEFCDPNPQNPGCKTSCPAARFCDGNLLRSCNADTGISTVTCSTAALCQCALTNTCPAGLATNGCGQPLCVAGNFRCTSGRLERCRASRDGWDLVQNCGAPDLCATTTNATVGACLECSTLSELRCFGAELRSCALTRWNLAQTCSAAPLGCVEATGNDYCATCVPGVSGCAGATLQTCAADRRTLAPTACTSAALCDANGGAVGAGQCDVCVEGTATCGGGELRRCSADGQMVNPQTCPADLCDPRGAGVCNACVPNSAWCTNEVLNLCMADGMTQTTEPCASTALCDAAGRACTAPTCAPGEPNCAGATLQVCNNDRTGFRDVTACASAALCSETGMGACMPPRCGPDRFQCTPAGVLQECPTDLTGWVDGPDCGNRDLCDAVNGRCIAPTCVAGARRCTAAGVLEECLANRSGWSMVQNCGAGLCDATALACDDCAAPDADCTANNELRLCDATGHWEVTPCGTQMCNANARMCVGGGNGGMGGMGGEAGTAGTAGMDAGGSGGTAGAEPGTP